jgi:hypothetical protein
MQAFLNGFIDTCDFVSAALFTDWSRFRSGNLSSTIEQCALEIAPFSMLYLRWVNRRASQVITTPSEGELWLMETSLFWFPIHYLAEQGKCHLEASRTRAHRVWYLGTLCIVAQ